MCADKTLGCARDVRAHLLQRVQKRSTETHTRPPQSLELLLHFVQFNTVHR